MRYVIAHNNADIIHYAELTDNQDMSTAQPNVEEFTDRQEWVSRLTELGIDDIPEPSPKPKKPFNHHQEREIEKVKKEMRAEASQRIEMIADIIEKAQGQEWANDKQKIADEIRDANTQGRK